MMKVLVAALMASTVLGWAGQACAQADATADTSGTATKTQTNANQTPGLEKVVVTARKRQEDAQAVPISITAFSQADLDKLNIKTLQDLTYATPSVYIAPTTFRQDTLDVTIRGQRDFEFQLRPGGDVL